MHLRHRAKTPIEFGVQQHPHHRRGVDERRVIWSAGLKQQDPCVRISGESIRKNAARRTGAYDDEIIHNQKYYWKIVMIGGKFTLVTKNKTKGNYG